MTAHATSIRIGRPPHKAIGGPATPETHGYNHDVKTTATVATPAPTSTAVANQEMTAFAVLAAISVAHLLNDTIQSLLPAIYPLLKATFNLSFAQIGMMTLALMLTASVLQPVVGHYTDSRPTPNALLVGMAFSLAGLLLLAVAHTYWMLLPRPAWSGSVRPCSIPSRHALREWHRADGMGSRSRCSRSEETSGRRPDRWWPRSSSRRSASGRSPGAR